MVSEQDCRRIAAEAALDVRTVRRVLGGATVRSLATLKAIQSAMIALGISDKPAKPGTIPVLVSPKATTRKKVRR